MAVAGGRASKRRGDPAPGGPRPQPPRPRRRHPPRPARRPDRRERVGEEFAGLRHDPRRGAAAVHRGALELRPAVPRPDGTARRRPDRGPAADRRDRPEVGLGQPAEHRRHRHRGLRLPPAPLRPDRRTALPEVRPGDPPAGPRADRRPGPRARRGNQGARPGPDGPGPEGAAPRSLPGDPRGPPDAGQGRRPGRRGRRRASQARQDEGPRHRGRRRPPGRPRGHPPPDRRERRPGPEARRGDGHPLDPGGRRLGRPDLQHPLRLPELRDEPGRGRAPDLLLQQPPRRLPDLRRPGFVLGSFDPDLVVPDRSQVARARARSPPGRPCRPRPASRRLDDPALGFVLEKASSSPKSTPLADWPAKVLGSFFQGEPGGYRGRPGRAWSRRYAAAKTDARRAALDAFRSEVDLPGLPRGPAPARGPGGDGRRPGDPRADRPDRSTRPARSWPRSGSSRRRTGSARRWWRRSRPGWRSSTGSAWAT